MRGKPLGHATDGSAFVTGLLLAMVLPANVAYYCPIVGGFFAIAIAKHCMGGLGNNIWNPALIARIFLQFAYPVQISLSRWPTPRLLWGSAAAGVDAATMPTPLFKGGGTGPFTFIDLMWGNGVAGCIGETCKVALLAGGIYLILRDIIDWRVPAFYVGTVFVLSSLLPASESAPTWARADSSPIYHIFSGGLFIGAFYMATDMVTTPITSLGRTIFAVGCGVVVVIIRLYGGYPEGVAYSIVLMNTSTPLIDRWVRPRVYGSTTPRAVPTE
jgi:electron transport complex protein RnfD